MFFTEISMWLSGRATCWTVTSVLEPLHRTRLPAAAAGSDEPPFASPEPEPEPELEPVLDPEPVPLPVPVPVFVEPGAGVLGALLVAPVGEGVAVVESEAVAAPPSLRPVPFWHAVRASAARATAAAPARRRVVRGCGRCGARSWLIPFHMARQGRRSVGTGAGSRVLG